MLGRWIPNRGNVMDTKSGPTSQAIIMRTERAAATRALAAPVEMQMASPTRKNPVVIKPTIR